MKTEKELEDIKAELDLKFDKITTVRIPSNDSRTEFRTLFLKKLDKLTLDAVQKLSATNSQKAVEVFFKNTLIGGDDISEILSDFDMSRTAESVVVELISFRRAE